LQPGKYVVPPAPEVPRHIPRPSFADHPRGVPKKLRDDEYGAQQSPDMIRRMRGAGQLAAEALEVACEAAREGVTTDEVDRQVCQFIVSRGGYPVGINYHGFPRGICSSPNEVAVHGIPDTRPLESGDIVNFDVVAFYDGAYGDCSKMAAVGDVDKEALTLIEATRSCCLGAIDLVGPGVVLNSIGRFCVDFAERRDFSVVSEYCGHFIGRELHMRPNVLHVPNRTNLVLKPGMTFTIEPVLVEGDSGEVTPALADGWTILSKSGGWCAQWEHTVVVTDNGAEILTRVL